MNQNFPAFPSQLFGYTPLIGSVKLHLSGLTINKLVAGVIDEFGKNRLMRVNMSRMNRIIKYI